MIAARPPSCQGDPAPPERGQREPAPLANGSLSPYNWRIDDALPRRKERFMNEADPHVELAARLGYGQSKRLPEIFRRLATLGQARLGGDLTSPPDDPAARVK